MILVCKYYIESLPEPLVEKLVCSRGCKALNTGVLYISSDPDTQKYKTCISKVHKTPFSRILLLSYVLHGLIPFYCKNLTEE
jgi:hypothetical protein